MKRNGSVFKSSIGSKAIMAITGIMLFGFLISHLAGNLLVFAGPEAINAYGKGLRDLPLGLLWVLRLGILVAAVVHIVVGIQLQIANRQARPVAYAYKNTVQASKASLNMIWSGLALLFFIIYHLLHFTFRVAGNPIDRLDALGRQDVYAMVVDGFQHPAIAISYILAMLFMAMHLKHGLSSLFQTLGLTSKAYRPLIETSGLALSFGLALGFCSIPVAIWLGFVG